MFITKHRMCPNHERTFFSRLTWSWAWLGFVCLCSHFEFLLALRYTVHSRPGIHEHGGAGVEKQPTCRWQGHIFKRNLHKTQTPTSSWRIWLTWTWAKYLLAGAQRLQQVKERHAVVLREVEQENPQHLQVLDQSLGLGSQLVPQWVQVVTYSLVVGEYPNKTFAFLFLMQNQYIWLTLPFQSLEGAWAFFF